MQINTLRSTKPIYIVSVYQGKSEEDDQELHDYERVNLNAFQRKFKEVLGQYKGKKEKAFMLTDVKELLIRNIALDYNQESYLEITPGLGSIPPAAFLINPRTMRKIGLWYFNLLNKQEACTKKSQFFREPVFRFGETLPERALTDGTLLGEFYD